MKVIIFGSTGGIGKWALKHALEKGHEVTAFVRSPQKVTMKHERLTLIKGDVTRREDYMNALVGQEAVIWSFAPAVRKLIFTLPRKVMHGGRQSEGYVLELGKYALRACSERKIFTSAA